MSPCSAEGVPRVHFITGGYVPHSLTNLQDFQLTHKTYNLPTRQNPTATSLSTYLQDFQQTSTQKSDRNQDFKPT